jgi:hypothetical protein
MDWHMAALKAVIANCAGVKITAEDFMGKKSSPDDELLEIQLTALFGCGPKVKQNG